MNALKHEPALAEALERALADRGSAAAVLEREVADLIELAHRFEESAAEVTPSAEFRAAARQRLLVHMARSAGVRPKGVPIGDRLRLWVARLAAGLAAVGLAGAAAASASASALPGDPLYPVKQATEAVTLQLATSDSAREEILLHRADTRLDEAARLLEQGRATEAAATAARYGDTLGTLTATTGSEAVEANLRTNEVRLTELLQTAPALARPGLERALAATERSLIPSRPTVPPAITQAVETVATATPAPRQTARPSDADDRDTPNPQALRPADAGERGIGESLETPAAAPGRRVDGGGNALPAEVEAGPASDDGSSRESHSSAVSESRAAPHANPQPPTTQSARTPADRTAVPHSQAGGRGRP